MRRRGVTVGVALAVLLAAVLALRSSDDRSGYRVAVIFDTARGMVPGQVIKIAGSKVGSLEHVSLTRDRKARMIFEVDRDFGPFRADASCKILPEGFISESFVQCDPGTPGRPELGGPDGMPTVPVERTTASVQLQQVLDTFSLPVSERVAVILSELGMATVGRGKDLNAMLRRANPALGQAREMLRVINRQREDVRAAIAQTDRVLVELGARDRDVRRFVDRSATVAETTAARATGISASIRRLPPLLTEVRSRLAALDDVGRRLTPTARDLRRSAPGLTQVNASMQSFARTGVPALAALTKAAKTGRTATAPATKTVKRVGEVASTATRPALLARETLESLRDRGGFEALLDTFIGMATHTGAFDGVSHLQALTLSVNQDCIWDPTLRGCDHRYTAEKFGKVPIGTEGIPDTAANRRRITRSKPAQELVSLLDFLLK